MSEFVKLTRMHNKGPIWVNFGRVRAIFIDSAGDSLLEFREDEYNYVTETPEQIMALIDGPADRDALVVEADSNAPAQRDVEFTRALAALVNCHSRENGSDTPDYLLAAYLMGCLRAYVAATAARDKWYGYRGMGGFNAACIDGPDNLDAPSGEAV